MVVLEGEGGIGKTRLAAELLAHAAAHGARTAVCASMELGVAAPFALWAELLRSLAPTLRSVPPEAQWPDELAALVPSLPARLGRAATALPAPAAPGAGAFVRRIAHAARGRGRSAPLRSDARRDPGVRARRAGFPRGRVPCQSARALRDALEGLEATCENAAPR